MFKSLRSLVIVSIVLIAVTAFELWLPGYGLVNLHTHLTDIGEHLMQGTEHIKSYAVAQSTEKIKSYVWEQSTEYIKSYVGDCLSSTNNGESSNKDEDNCDKSDVKSDINSNSDTPRSRSNATTLYFSDAPYENFFYSDSNVAAQVIVTSPLPDSDLQIVGPRVVVAWPAGNSGACMFFQPQNGRNGSLAIKLINSTIGSPLAPIHKSKDNGIPHVGVEGVISFNSTAVLSLSILGSIRAIRDYTEGASVLHPMLQNGIHVEKLQSNGASISRLWLDNVTTTTVTLVPRHSGNVKVKNHKVILEAGEYHMSAYYNYPQLRQLGPESVLKDKSLLEKHEKESKSLSFLSYSDKVVGGAWRFLTYFGRDDMLSAMILLPVLTEDVVEAVIGSVLERINRTDGSACHEETIGDYATFLNLQDGIASTAYRCDYSMVDTDYLVPILMHAHFDEHGAGQERLEALLDTPAGKVDVNNKGLKWGDLFVVLAQKIIRETAPFASMGGQTRENLIHLKEGHDTGAWRDSIYGLGGGRIPFDVNVALAPAALRSIASLAKVFGTSAVGQYARDWAVLADQYARVWEDNTLEFFRIVLPEHTARGRLERFVNTSSFYNGPSHAELIDDDIAYYAVALEGHNDLDLVSVMHTDANCRILFLNGTNQARLTNYLNQTALSVLRPFPAGLMTPVGLVVANPAFSESQIARQNFTNAAYHGTVVWSWQLVAMVRGLEKQLDRCSPMAFYGQPEFCSNQIVYNNVKKAYNVLYDFIEENADSLSDEVWSWRYDNGKFIQTPLGSLPAPPGVEGTVESDIVQLWSLTFLALKRNEKFR